VALDECEGVCQYRARDGSDDRNVRVGTTGDRVEPVGGDGIQNREDTLVGISGFEAISNRGKITRRGLVTARMFSPSSPTMYAVTSGSLS
jgi:hypothetical protein